jgi:hypothetical protein
VGSTLRGDEDMKKGILIVIVLMMALFTAKADACVGKTLTIGVIDSLEGRVFSEMLSTLVNERMIICRKFMMP